MATKTAQYWIDKLQLETHTEGGFMRETYRSPMHEASMVYCEGHPKGKPFSNHLYYMLQAGQYSAWIATRIDESWNYFEGTSAMVVHMIDAEGKYSRVKLGKDPDQGQQFQVCIPAGTWYAAHAESFTGFSLIGVSCSPAFGDGDLLIGYRKKLLKLFPQHFQLVNRFAYFD